MSSLCCRTPAKGGRCVGYLNAEGDFPALPAKKKSPQVDNSPSAASTSSASSSGSSGSATLDFIVRAGNGIQTPAKKHGTKKITKEADNLDEFLSP